MADPGAWERFASTSKINAGSGPSRCSACTVISPAPYTTTELVLSHKHPDDRDQIAQTIDTIRRTGQPLSSRHRIVDTSGKVRSV